MSKRKKFILVSFLLSLGLLGAQFVRVEFRNEAIILLGGISFLLSAWSLYEDLKGVEWLTVLALPVLYPISVGFFYFLLPERLLSRMMILVIFAIGMYALLLTENIFSVAAIRTIQLLRAAHAVGFLLTLVTAFFLFDTILSFRMQFYFNFFLVLLITFPLMLQGLWSYRLSENAIEKRVVLFASVLALAVAEIALVLSFWPVTVPVGSLFLVTVSYIGLGISQYYFEGRLFSRTLYEYLGVGIVVLITTLLVTRWD